MAALREVVLAIHLVLLNELHLYETVNLAEADVLEYLGGSYAH